MKRIMRFLVLSLLIALLIPLISSCKKGDGDPFFSIYSRKERLCGDWKVTKIEETVEYKTTKITTTFDGNKKKVDLYVTDTVVNTVDGPIYYWRDFWSYTGTLLYSFEKAGTYQIDEAFTDDTTWVQYTSQEKGLWFFTGGGAESNTKPKELLGLQPTSYVYNPLNPDTYTLTYTGQNIMYIYHIYTLSKKEIELRYDIEETTNLFTMKTHGKIVLEPR
jgi:hypothetical protein